MVQPGAVKLRHLRAFSSAIAVVRTPKELSRRRFLTFWLMRSSSSSLIPSFRFISLTSLRCTNSCRSATNISFLAISRCRTMAISCRASSSSFLSRLSFSALWASLPRVFRTWRTSLRRKHTYGSPSSVSCPDSNYTTVSSVFLSKTT